MTAEKGPAEAAESRGGRVALAAIAFVFLVVLGAYLRGLLAPEAGVPVEMLDAGLETGFAVGKVVPYPDLNVYLVGMEDGHIRAVDGVIEGSQCVARWAPEDARGGQKNPRGVPGTLADPCSDALWAVSGDALSGVQHPLRTFVVTGVERPDGRHVQVEVLGERHPTPVAR